jgi:hypothetical protein
MNVAGVSGKRKKRSKKSSPDNPAQSARFIKAAKELGLDQASQEAFERAMEKLTKPKKQKAN